MASGLQKFQLGYLTSAPIVGLGLSVASGTNNTNATSALSTLLATAGDSGQPVPMQQSISSAAEGLITTGVNNRVTLWYSGTKDSVRSGEEEVYARLSVAGAVYTFNYFSNVQGTETAYVFPAATAIDFVINYRYRAALLPTDAFISAASAQLNSDASGSGGGARAFGEALPVTIANQLPALAKTPADLAVFRLFVNGICYFTDTVFPSYSISGKAISWTPANGFNLPVGSDVKAIYTTFEA